MVSISLQARKLHTKVVRNSLLHSRANGTLLWPDGRLNGFPDPRDSLAVMWEHLNLTLICGSGGLIGFTSSRLLRMWTDIMNRVFGKL